MTDDGATLLMIKMLLRKLVTNQLRARGYKGMVTTARMVDDQLWVKVGDKTVAITMTNSIQALASSIWRMSDDNGGELPEPQARGE